MKNDDWIFSFVVVVIVLAFLGFVALVLFGPRHRWTSDLTHATCEQLRAGVSYTCVQDGVVYVCVDDWSTYHRSCAKLPTVSP